MTEIYVGADYKHDKTQNIYHTLLLSSPKGENVQKVVYVDNYGKIWSKDVERFLKGMKFLNKDNAFLYHSVIDKKYPQPGEFYYDSRKDDGKAHAACSVLFVTNTEADKEDYPVTIFYICDGSIDYLTLSDFNKHFKK